MKRHHSFSRDSLLLPNENALLQVGEQPYAEIVPTLGYIASAWNVLPAAPTVERWSRMLGWCGALDTMLDDPTQNEDPLPPYNDAISVLLPEPWEPDYIMSARQPAIYNWGAVVRPSFEDGDVAAPRRQRMYATAATLGKISRQKRQVTSPQQYVQTLKAEGMLVGDLLIDCMSNEELAAPQAPQMRKVFWEWGKASTLMDSLEDLVADSAAGILSVPCDEKTQSALQRAVFLQHLKMVGRWPLKMRAILTV